ncbi:MAG: hypothetical protein Q7U60_01815, partial [Candidatus Methanoperedens sp.]|nr:hypothetical protein [Candidatus Methanoperedens sp.]
QSSNRVIILDIKTINGKSEVIIGPEDREFITNVNERLKRLTRDEKELIKSIIEKNLRYCETNRSTPYITYAIYSGLADILDSNAANFISNCLINHHHNKTIFDTLIKEGLISEITSKFILELGAEYGGALLSIKTSIDDPYEWGGMGSDILVSENVIKLQSRIYLTGGEVLRFTSEVKHVPIFSMHFIDNALNAVKKIDKEKILEFNEIELDDLEKKVAELKELYRTVKSEIEKTEPKEPTSPTS